MITSINFFKNGQEHTYYPAASCRLYYQPNNFIRFVLDYTKVQTATIGATWLNVKSTYLDLDAHILMHFTDGNKGLIYVILGASTQSWKGYYTGFDDYNSAADAKIKPKTNEKALYFGGSVGTGFEYRIIPRIDAYGEVRFRITNTDVGFGLSDVCYGIGIKYTLLKTHPKTHKNAGKHFKWFKGDFNKTVN